MAHLYQLCLKILVFVLSLSKRQPSKTRENLQLKIKNSSQTNIKLSSKAYSLVELLAGISLIIILMSVSSAVYVKYSKDTQLQLLKNHGDMIAQSLLDCMFYKKNSKECLLNISDDGTAYNLKKKDLLAKIELTEFEEPIHSLKASWDKASNGQNFCFQFKRKVREQIYKICVSANRKKKLIHSMLIEKNFCCNEFGGACALPLRLKSSVIKDVSSSDCKNKGFSDDFFSYLSRSGFSQAKCNQGTCIQMSSSVCPSGQSWNGSACACPAGSHLSGGNCITCSGGQSWNGSTCACPAGSHLSGGNCITCSGGQSWNGSACACPAGLHLSGGNCITPSCPPNQRWNSSYKVCQCKNNKYRIDSGNDCVTAAECASGGGSTITLGSTPRCWCNSPGQFWEDGAGGCKNK